MRLDLLYLLAGAVLGVLMRYYITGDNLFIGSLPVSVLIVNIIGSLILGASAAAITGLGLSPDYTLFIGIGFCGTLTTMSTFALESMNLVGVGEFATAGAYIFLNVGCSFGAILLGRAIVNLLIGLG
jgi:fluoride exporter